MEWLIAAIAAALAPFIPLEYVSGRLMAHARSLWLAGLLTVGIVWLAPRELWLALIALCFLARWPRHVDPPSLTPSLIHWIGVGLTWALLLAIPKAWFAWILWGWLAMAAWQVWVIFALRFLKGGRQKGTLGSPVITALYLALISPFCPWWGWPVLGLGLGLIWSYSAFVGVGVGLVWLYPSLWPLGLVLGGVGAVLWCWSPVVWGNRLLEHTPRGDTIDSMVSRFRGWQLICHHGTERWLLGHGPNSMEPAMLRWGSRYDQELTWGESFCEPLQIFYEYGLVGVAAMMAFLWRIVPNLRFGDPWSAAFIVMCILSLVHWPARHVSIAVPAMAIAAYLAH